MYYNIVYSTKSSLVINLLWNELINLYRTHIEQFCHQTYLFIFNRFVGFLFLNSLLPRYKIIIITIKFHIDGRIIAVKLISRFELSVRGKIVLSVRAEDIDDNYVIILYLFKCNKKNINEKLISRESRG